MATNRLATLNAFVAAHSELLDRWEKYLLHHFLASGFAPEQASDAVSSTKHKYARYIAELAPARIKNACNGYSEPCEACAKGIEEAKKRFSEIVAEEGRRKLDPWEYSIPTPPCPLPRKESL